MAQRPTIVSLLERIELLEEAGDRAFLRMNAFEKELGKRVRISRKDTFEMREVSPGHYESVLHPSDPV